MRTSEIIMLMPPVAQRFQGVLAGGDRDGLETLAAQE